MHKIKEYESYLALLTSIPQRITIFRVKGHQEDIQYSADLTIPDRVNITANKIATRHTKYIINI